MSKDYRYQPDDEWSEEVHNDRKHRKQKARKENNADQQDIAWQRKEKLRRQHQTAE